MNMCQKVLNAIWCLNELLPNLHVPVSPFYFQWILNNLEKFQLSNIVEGLPFLTKNLEEELNTFCFIVCRSRAENADDFQYLINTLIFYIFKVNRKKSEVVICGRGKNYSFSREGSQLDVVITTLNMLLYRCYI